MTDTHAALVSHVPPTPSPVIQTARLVKKKSSQKSASLEVEGGLWQYALSRICRNRILMHEKIHVAENGTIIKTIVLFQHASSYGEMIEMLFSKTSWHLLSSSILIRTEERR